MRARNLNEFCHEMRRWGAPSVNQVYADTSGEIAWLPVGYTPLRSNWDGLLPVPGDGRYEWAGFIDPDRLPRVVNPLQGYLATANELNLPDDWDHGNIQVGFEWVERSRATRIDELLKASRPHTIATSCAIQTDDSSMPARRTLRVLQRARTRGETDARVLFRDWSGSLGADSAPAALFEVWWTKH
jgi:penicillin amidase